MVSNANQFRVKKIYFSNYSPSLTILLGVTFSYLMYVLSLTSYHIEYAVYIRVPQIKTYGGWYNIFKNTLHCKSLDREVLKTLVPWSISRKFKVNDLSCLSKTWICQRSTSNYDNQIQENGLKTTHLIDLKTL